MEVEAETQAQDEVQYGGFWIRLVAVLIDSVLLLLILGPILLLLFGVDYFVPAEPQQTPDLATSVLDALINNVVPAVVTIVMWLKLGGTPGKLLLGLAVVDKQNFEAISLKQAVLRYLGYIPSTLILMLGFLWVVFDDRKRGWHDMIGGTVVIKRRK
ncbi:RDD family protein [Neiella sp. HB171785]|uniref:RDD family protein n=1 Tax=Neiella litorisoli TaxID=2771431 RepID=A0A8J6QUF6_9GAMM|nr:RDD family protein [Neiella litorisoli]MBD1390979.1 RDD family protein [Neiella litorisoli]